MQFEYLTLSEKDAYTRKTLKNGSWHYPPVFYKLMKTGKPEKLKNRLTMLVWQQQ